MALRPCLIPLLLNAIVCGASSCLSPDGEHQQGTVSLVYNGTVLLADGNMTGADNVVEGREYFVIDLKNVIHVTEVQVGVEKIHNMNYSIDGVTWNERFNETEQKENNCGFLARFMSINATGLENASVEVMGCTLEHFTLITGRLQPGITRWPPSNKTILVTNKVLIGPNSTLIVNPGVKVIYNANAGIVVQGSLIVNGTAGNLISFSGMHDNKWSGITVFNGDLYMNFVDVVKGESLLTSANSTYVDVILNNSRIDMDKIEMKSSLMTIKITSSNITFNSMQLTITNHTDKIQEEPLDTSKSSHIRNGQIFIASSNFSGRNLDDSSNSSVTIHSEKRTPDPNVNFYRYSGQNWVKTKKQKNKNFNLTISENRFRTSVSIEGLFKVVHVGNNHFQTSSELLIDIGDRIQEGFDGNQIGATRYLVITLDWRQEKIYRTDKVSVHVSVVGNNFTGSDVIVTCPYRVTKPVKIFGNEFRGSALHLGTPDVVIKRNKFILKTPQVVYSGTTYKFHEIDARENFWGCRTTAAIERKILDYKQNSNFPKVNYLPYIKEMNMTTLEYKTSFIACDGKQLGGQIGGRVVLSRDKSPYTAVSDIYVGKEDTLIIEPGVKIRFKKGVAFTVDGSLLMKGSPAHPVELVPETEGKEWKGLILGPKRRPSIRLAGGADDREGTVLVWRRSRYAPMCFREGTFNYSHADVICRMAGFDPAGGVSIGPLQTFSGGRTTDVRYSFGHELVCSGKEPDLINCKGYYTWCGTTDAYPDKPFVRCLGDRIVYNELASSNIIQLTGVIVEGTDVGILLAGNVSVFDNVTSKYSKSAGVTFDPGFKGDQLPEVRNLTSSFNHDGVIIESDKSYRNLIFNECNIRSNKRYAFLLAGYPSILIKDSTINGSEVGIYSDHHNDLNVTVDSTSFLNLRTAVYLKSWEELPSQLWKDIYRSNVTLIITNSAIVGQNLNKASIVVFSLNGSVNIKGNMFNRAYGIHLRSRSSRFVIEDNVFTNNTGIDVVKIQSIYFYETPYPPLTNASGSIQRNVFRDNSGNAMVAVDLADNYRTRISGNVLRDNNATYAISIDAGEVILTNNTLMNLLTACEVSFKQERDVTSARNENNLELSKTSMSHSKVCIKNRYNWEECTFCLRRDQPERGVASSVVFTT